MYYRPRLPNGELVPLPWPIHLYRFWNFLIWPLHDDVRLWQVYLDRIIRIMGFLTLLLQIEVDFHYLLVNRKGIDIVLTGFPTFLIVIDVQIRTLHLGFHKEPLKKLLKQFYSEYIILHHEEPRLYKSMKREMLLLRVNAILYILTLFNYIMVLVNNVLYNRRDMLHPQIYPFDETQLHYFIPLSFLNVWVGMIIDSILFGELNMLGELMLHLNARYTQLGEKFKDEVQQILSEYDECNVAAEYCRRLKKVLRRNIDLNTFAASIENEYSFRNGIMFAISTVLLCTMTFKAYTSPLSNLALVCWTISKSMDLLVLGTLGSNLYKTTDDLSVMYYSSNWEKVVYKSTNVRENVKLMKLVSLSIAVNSQPIYLTGLKYFRISLSVVVKIIQGAFSYFTFLLSMRKE